MRQTSTVGSPASCSLIIPIICASVKRLFLMRLLLLVGRLYIRMRDLSGGRSLMEGAAEQELGAGTCLLILAGTPHWVTYTADPTIWLAVHIGEG